MQIKRSELTKTKYKLSISSDQATLDNIKTHVLRRLATNQVKLPGFRAGKAPLSLVEKNIDQNLLQSEFLDEAVNRMYTQAIKAEKIRPVEQPKISLKKFVPFTMVEFEAEVEAISGIDLADYTKIRKKPIPVIVDKKDVDGVISNLRQRIAERREVSRPSRDSDEVIVNFNGTDSKNQPVKGAEGKDYPLVLGSNSFIPGFEPNLVGLKVGQDKTFTITFPKDYNMSALQSKKVTFKVKIKKVHEIIEPKIDDAFAAKIGPFKSLAELKKDIKNQLTIEQQRQADTDFNNELIKEIVSKSSVEVPESLIDEEVERAEQAERQNLSYRGQTWQEHLAEEGVSDEEHRKNNRPAAEENVKASLILSEIAQRENITVTPEELEVRLQLLKGQYSDKAMQAELDKPENHSEIESRLITEKTIAKIRQYVDK